MENWKERLKAEYAQVKERYEKLKVHNTKQEVEYHVKQYSEPIRSEAESAEREKDSYRRALMHKQQTVMDEYLHILELRATLDNIDL